MLLRMKTLQAAALTLLCALALTGCGKIKIPGISRKTTPTPAPVPVASAAPTPAPAPPTTTTTTTTAPVAAPAQPAASAAPTVDRNAQVVVLCYHRLEGKAGGALSIEPALFEKQMQELKDLNLSVISMQDFIAWRAGKKSIPAKSVLITIDDGYVSGLEVGVPILKKFGYPATFFVYLEYINKGGKSVTWAQLGELRDEGFEIGSHTVSHENLQVKSKKTKIANYEEWLKDEVGRSKEVLESQLGIRVSAIAYPFGNHNQKVHEAVRAAGYDVAFTTYGQRVGITASPYTIGRYDVTSKDAQGHDGFTAAVSFQGPSAPSGPSMAQEAAAMMITQPANGSVVNNPKPHISANLATLGALDPGSIQMRISGLGSVPAEYDPKSKAISYTPIDPLRTGPVTVIISGKVGQQPVETKWSFKVDPNATPSGDADALTQPPPR
jgi:peptidoglycan/xylan/chitin deacetylase (PgdA/CDA1 family)